MDNDKSVEQLENDYWKDSEYPTNLIEKCHFYRKIPIKDLTIEQLRLLIGQNIGLHFLIPKAIEILKVDIFAEGDLYPGDLLNSVLTSDKKYWQSHNDLKEDFAKFIKKSRLEIEKENELSVWRQIRQNIEKFL